MAKRLYTQKIVSIEAQIDTAIAIVNQNVSFLRVHIESVEALSEIQNPTPNDLLDLENAKKCVGNSQNTLAAAKANLAALQALAPDYVSSNTVWTA